MTSIKILIAVIVLVAYSSVSAQYDTYEHSEEEDEHDEEKPRVDYSKYFGGLGGITAPSNPTQAADSSTGFVQPLDFTGFFAGGHFGLGGLAGTASQQVFQTPGGVGVALPLTSGVFPVVHEPVTSNTSGFVNDVKFPSLFDSSSSSTDNGFRPKDFLIKGSQPDSTSPNNFYSPAFSSLQKDVDSEVNYQRKEQDNIERSRAANRREPEYDVEDKDDDDEFDSFEFDDTSEIDYRSSKKNIPILAPNKNEERYGNSNRKQVSYDTPYSTVNQVNLQGPSRPRPAQGAPKTPLPSVSDPEDDDTIPISYPTKQYSGKSPLPPRSNSRKNYNQHYPRTNIPPKQSYNAPSHLKQTSNPYIPTYNPGYHKPITKEPLYHSSQPKKLAVSSRPQRPNFNKPPTYFRPSPRDPYMDTSQEFPKERRSSNTKTNQPVHEGIYSLPQTEYATVVERTPKQPAVSATEKSKLCKKVKKEIDHNDFSRFKRQQMTCYICTNKEKGNTYEECSYESDPKANSFYKGSAEAYSSDTILTPTKYQTRERRSLVHYRNNGERHKNIQASTPIRRIRQHDYDYDDPDERGHGPEHYRFGPEHFQDHEGRSVKRKQGSPTKRTDYEDDYIENEEEEETDVEKEYEPPGTSESDDCHKVNRNGIICMVCKKPKTGGTYEQCSYASDPDANRYEYAKSSSYGSKRPQHYRYKRNTSNKNYDGRKYKGVPGNKRYYRQMKGNEKRRGDFRNGKLKRKKAVRGDYEMPMQYYQNGRNKNASNEEAHQKIVGLDPFFYGSAGEPYNPDNYDERGRKIKRKDGDDEETAATSNENESDDAIPSYEDSFYRLFPELVGTDPYTGESIVSKVKEKEANEKHDDFEHPEIPYEEAEDEEESESVQTNNKVKPGFAYGVDLPDYYFDDDNSKKDLEKTLDEFTHKNRSDCKKVMKDKMTCYQCINKNGLQHEECMFVAASEPKSKHLAYHEVKEFRVTPTEKSSNESTFNGSNNAPQNKGAQLDNPPKESNIEQVKQSGILSNPNEETHSKIYRIPKKNRRRKKEEMLKKVMPQKEKKISYERPAATEDEPHIAPDILKMRSKEMDPRLYGNEPRISHQSERRKRNPKEAVTAESKRQHRRESSENNKSNDSKEDEEAEEIEEENVKKSPKRPNYNSVPPDPEGFDEREGPEGAYSHETEPVYDKVLKITLPRYMLTRSEHEDIFDEVLRSG